MHPVSKRRDFCIQSKKNTMFSKTTFQIKVSVIPEYDIKNSFPSDNRFVFKYHITIENLSQESIAVLRRKWLIYDVGLGCTEGNGNGISGLTPGIEPGQQFTCFSNVMLRSGVGSMSGKYFVTASVDGLGFEID